MNYDAYPFSRTEPVPSGYIYAFVKDQIAYQTGKYDIECPHCRKQGSARVSKKTKFAFSSGGRMVRTACRHCGTQVSFLWKGSI